MFYLKNYIILSNVFIFYTMRSLIPVIVLLSFFVVCNVPVHFPLKHLVLKGAVQIYVTVVKMYVFWLVIPYVQ